MKKFDLKKVITVTSLVCVGVSVVLGILLLLGIVPANALVGKIYLSLLTVFISGIFLLNALETLNRKNVFGYITSGFIGLSAVMFLISIWGELGGTFLQVTVWTAMATILLDMFIGNVIVLEDRYLFLQIPEYICLAYIEVVVGLCITNLTPIYILNAWQIFAVAVLLFLGLFIAISIILKGERGKEPAPDKKKVVLTQKEYQALLDKIKDLEEKLAKK